MKLNKNNKSIAMLVSLIALLVVFVGSTIAYLFMQTDSITNTFTPTSTGITIVEENEGSTKNNVKITNTGEIKAYIRATVVVTWKDTNGNVYGKAPVENTDYEVNWTMKDWVKGSDGFYYYKEPVESGDSTGVLLTDCKPVEGKAPEGYNLSVEILAQAIQAEPTSAVTDAWKVSVDEYGKITPKS